MPSSRAKPLLLTLACTSLALVGAGVWWAGRDAPSPRPLVRPPEDVPIVRSEPVVEEVRDAVIDEAPPAELQGTTVIWPLEVQLTLLARAALRAEDGVLPPGSGASASLHGHVWGPADEGLRATIEFTAGSNVGRKLVCDADGAFGATDLYPGLNVVRVHTPIGYTAEREVRLRSRQEELLNLGFGRPASVFGQVLDAKGAPIVGAEVTLDGQEGATDEEGTFFFSEVASGVALATVYKPGYARYREAVPITAGRTIEKEQLVFRLARSASLEVIVEGAAGSSRAPVKVFLFPLGAQRVNSERGQQTFPWHLVSPIDLHPGGSRVIDGLPDGHVLVAAFRPGAVTERTTSKVRLYEGRTVQEVVRLLPGPAVHGRIVRAGKPVEGVRVRLEAPNRQTASELVLKRDASFPQELVFPHLPAGLQESFTDGEGRFQFTLYPDVSSSYYLTAETLDGLWRASSSVRAEPTDDFVLELERASQSVATLSLRLSPRFQGLPVAVKVQGAPRDPLELAPRAEALEIDGLEAGTWRLDVAWHDDSLLENFVVQVGQGVEQPLFVQLPPGAVDGQSEEERRRAGR